MPRNNPDKTVGRLCIYRRILARLRADGAGNVFSHELASAMGATSAQVRRDLMIIGCSGTPSKGYCIESLISAIGKFLDSPGVQSVALVGVGNVGRAILSSFAGQMPQLKIVATFDNDPAKAGRVIQGCRCYGIDRMADVVKELGIVAAIIAIPTDQAQGVADILIDAGVKGLLNFAPASLRVPAHVYIENVDIMTLLEKVAFFARQ